MDVSCCDNVPPFELSTFGRAMTPVVGMEYSSSHPALLTVPEAAKVLGIGRTLAYELVRTDCWPTPVIRAGKLIKNSGWPASRSRGRQPELLDYLDPPRASRANRRAGRASLATRTTAQHRAARLRSRAATEAPGPGAPVSGVPVAPSPHLGQSRVRSPSGYLGDKRVTKDQGLQQRSAGALDLRDLRCSGGRI